VPEAIDQFEIAVRLEPSNPDLHYNLGVTLAHAGRRQEAAAELEAVSRLGGGGR